MKIRIFLLLILSSVFVSLAQGSGNCCGIQVGGVQITGANQSVPADTNGPGGTYQSTLTQTFPIACVNTQTGNNCNSTSPPNNVVTATGAGGNRNGNFVACNPTFQTTTTQANPNTTTAASFTDQATGYASVSDTGNCVQQNPQPFAISTCVVVSCSTQSTCSCSPGARVCPCQSPIIIDVSGQGFRLTNAQNGVVFDITGTDTPIKMGWTSLGSDNAFLALPAADGLVHNGQQLFGDHTPQPPSDHPNGFAALAVYDDPTHGGNGDGIIDARDAVFPSLRLWIDTNHDGISQPEELHTLPSLGVNSISLDYKWDGRKDQFGNTFRYRAQINPRESTQTGRMAYDVFFDTLLDSNAKNNKCAVPTAALIPQKTGGF